MVSNSPDTQSINCPLCGESMRIVQPHPAWSGSCQHCGQLLWFSPSAGVVAPVVEFDHLHPSQRGVSLPEATYIPSHILKIVPGNVAMENRVFPIAELGAALVIAVSQRIDPETVEKLRFILNRRVLLVVVDDDTLSHQIDYHYRKPNDRLRE